MVEVEVEQDDFNYIATDFMDKRLDQIAHKHKKNQRQHERKLYNS